MCLHGQSNGNGNGRSYSNSKQLRILICSENVQPQLNGVARRVSEYEQGLLKAGHQVDLLHPYCEGKTWCLPHPWNSNANLMTIRPLYFLQHMLTKHSDYDIIHAVMPLNFSGGWILAVAELMRAMDNFIFSNSNRVDKKYPALVISYHLNTKDYIDIYSPPGVRDFQKFLMFSCLSRVLPLISDRILAPTRATEPSLLRLWPQDRIGICHTGVSYDFCPAAIDGPHGKRWLARKADFLKKTGRTYLLIVVGRLAPEKGIDHLISAMPFLHDCALWIVGDGPFRQQAETIVQSRQLPVDFLGYQRNEALHSLYGAADCFVCPSQTETYGQVVQEAFACGVRVALPCVPQFVEAYQPFLPENAWWIPDDVESMVTAIDSQVKLPPMTPKEKDHVRSQFMAWSDACNAMLVEYYEALEVSRSARRTTLNPITIIVVIVWILVTVVVNSVGHTVYLLLAFASKLLRRHRKFYLKEE